MANKLFYIGTLNAYEHVPQVSGKLPVLVMFPGKGEVGSTASKLLLNGPSKFINDGWDPSNMIIVSVQPIVEWPSPDYVSTIITNIIARYKDKSDGRLFLTGLSAGGYAIVNWLGKDAANAKKVTAIAVMSTPEPEPYFNPSFFTTPAWGFCGDKDSWYDKMKKLFTSTGKKFTTMVGYGHSGWNDFYNPAWKENGLNLYDWLDKQTAVTVTPPTEQTPKEVVITPGTDGGVYKRASDFNINPGDIVVLKGNYTYFNIKDLIGTAAKPITVLADGPVKIGGNKSYAMIFENSSYFNLAPATNRGNIVIDGGVAGFDSPGIALNKCHHLKIVGVEITNVSVGIMAKTTPQSEAPGTYESLTDNFSYDTLEITNNYIHDIRGEGTYLGCSTSTLMPVTINGIATQVYAYRVKNTKIINNIFKNTGWDGIQITAGDNVEISGNSITNYGTAKVGYQNYGIICAANNAKIIGNVITNGGGTGITGSFNGLCEIANNVLKGTASDPQQDAIYMNAHPIKDYPKLQPNIHDNYIDGCTRNCIRVANTDNFEVAGVIKNNKYKNSLGVVDASGSVLTNNVEDGTVVDPEPGNIPYPVSVTMSDGTVYLVNQNKQ